MFHIPVLLKESIESLNLIKGDIVVDGTLGGGGHARGIIEKIKPDGRLIGIDQDQNAVDYFQGLINKDKMLFKFASQIKLVRDNFSNLDDILKDAGVRRINAVLADLGFSSDQLENSGKGLSFKKNEPLDMRMNPEAEFSAEHVVNNFEKNILINILREYADEEFASQIVRAIVREREVKPIKTTSQLVSVIEKAVPGAYKHKKIHFATRTFQALRIAVNREEESLKKLIYSATEFLEARGRIAIISFHSGEDRMVKNIFRNLARGCVCPPTFPQCVCGGVEKVEIITSKPIMATEEEIEKNPRSRSAKLRVAEKL